MNLAKSVRDRGIVRHEDNVIVCTGRLTALRVASELAKLGVVCFAWEECVRVVRLFEVAS